MMRYILFSFLFLFYGTIHAQLTVDNVPPGPKIEYSPEQLAKTVLVKPNPLITPTPPQTVFPLNVVYNRGDATVYSQLAAKWETNLNAGNLGLGSNEYGVLLTTGQSQVALGPNDKEYTAIEPTMPSPPVENDQDLADLANVDYFKVRNISILEFDFVAQGYNLSFDYVFGSEEYPNYAPPIKTGYNDVFGFFLSGSGINGTYSGARKAVNLAQLPTTENGNSVVSINNVNAVTNNKYFVNNGKGDTPLINYYTQYNGFTTLLKAKYTGLICGETYHIKLAIGNVTDNAYDSGVFIKNFAVPPPVIDFNGISENPNVCNGEPAVLKVTGDVPPNAIYTWTKDGVVLIGETSPAIVATSTGKYCVDIKTPNSTTCISGSDCIDVVVLEPLPIVTPENMSVCTPLPPIYSPPFYFDIDQTDFILGNLPIGDIPGNYEVTYYDSSYLDAKNASSNGQCTIANGKFPNYPLSTASQTIWVRVESLVGEGCVRVESFQLDAFQTVAPTGVVKTQPTCTTPTGIIEVTSPLGAEFEYSIDGGVNFQPGITFTGLSPKSYVINYKNNITKCVSPDSSQLVVNNIPGAPANPVGTITQQPTCAIPTGIIVITSPINALVYEYSKGGGVYQTSPIFADLPPNNTYNITVKDLNTGCISAAVPFKINIVPFNPPAPTASQKVPPTCAVPTGTIEVTMPLGPTIEYSIDGVTYNPNPIITGVPPNTTVNVTIKETSTGCISSGTPVNIDPVPGIPAPPTVNEIQPTCTLNSGTITIISPVLPLDTYDYSVGNAVYQKEVIFTGLVGGNYNVTVREIATGCVSNPKVVIINPVLNVPIAPTANVTPPTCYIPSGTVDVTSPVGGNYEYSKDGGLSYQSSTNFAGLAPNTTVSINAKDKNSGCISIPSSFQINSIPPNPIAPIGKVTQPTCTIQTGKIEITDPTDPLGNDLEYSINAGGVYQSSPIFMNLPPNAVYSIIVRNKITGCVSSPSQPFVVDPVPSIPATPVALVDNNSPCEEGTFNLSTATVTGATYSWTGPDGFTSSEQNPSISDAALSMTGIYNIVIAIVSDCPSLPGSVTVSVKPLPEPSLDQDGYVCVDNQTNQVISTYTLNSGLPNNNYSFKWYDIQSGVPVLMPSQILNSYIVDTPGTYGVIATNTGTGCISEMVTATVVSSSAPESMNIVTSNYFSDNQTITVNALPLGVYEYQIDNGAFQLSNVFDNVTSGPHKIIVRDSKACGELEGVVETVDYPKFFTPNGDGYNDTWNIFSLKDQPKAKISIFDRFGKLITEIRPSGQGWDGTYNGKDLYSTDYWFFVDYIENGINKIFRAHFTLKR